MSDGSLLLVSAGPPLRLRNERSRGIDLHGRKPRSGGGGDNNKQWTQATASWGWTEESVVRSSVSGLRRPRCHIHLLEDGIADLQVSWGGRSHRQHTSTLIWKVWLFIVAASSIFDDCNFVVAGVTRRHSTLNRRLTRDLLVTPLHSGVTRCRLLFASHRREYSIK